MEHPPKQGLKQGQRPAHADLLKVLMEHPPKQGLKPPPVDEIGTLK